MKIYTPKEISEQEIFGKVTQRTIYNYLERGTLKGKKLSPKKWVITQKQVDEFFE